MAATTTYADALPGHQFAPLKPGTDIKIADTPFQLSAVKTMSYVYSTLPNGQDFEVQLGSVSTPVVATMFNGQDFDTKEDIPTKRKLYVSISANHTEFFDALDDTHRQHLFANKASLLPNQKNVSEGDIRSIFARTVRPTPYGDEVAMDVETTGRHRCRFFKMNEAQGVSELGEVPRSDTEGRPLKFNALVTLKFYAVVKMRQNGKKYEKIHLKCRPSKVLVISEASSGTGGGGTLDATLPTIVRGAPPASVQFTDPRVSDKYPTMSFSDVQGDGGQSLRLNFLPVGDYATPLTASVWPAMGSQDGPAVAMDVDLLAGTDGALEYLEQLDRAILAEILAKRDQLGGTGMSDEDIGDLYKPLVRDGGGRKTIRVKLEDASMPTVFTYTAPDTLPSDDPVTDLQVSEDACPRHIQCVPMQARFSITLMKTAEGALDGISPKMRIGALVLIKENMASMFGGMGPGGVEAAEPESKKIRLS
tara:strand:+ start:1 stop:1431 length:1431 start_codon:yes stop_codon:yes gene_type:complete